MRVVSDNPTVPFARLRYLDGILLLLFAAALAIQLFVPPIVGLADNGDFSRVAGPLGIFAPEDLGDSAFFSWIVPQYRFDAHRIWLHGLCCYSSQTALAVAALPVGLAASPPGRFDLRATGLVNGLALLAAVGLLLFELRPLPTPLRILGGLLLVVAFSDVTYVSLLNSFYTEPAALIFLLAALALALRLARTPNPRAGLPTGFFLVSALFATSRPQNALLGLLLAVLGWRVVRYERSVARHRRRLVALAALGLCAVSLAYSRSTPALLRRIYLFGAVFRQLLPNSPDPRGDLATLGLPPDYARFVGMSGFSPEAPVQDENFQRTFAKVRYRTLAAFYAARPARIRKALARGAGEAFEMRPFGLGNFAQATGKAARTTSESFSVWSRAKARLAPARLGFVVAWGIVSLAAAIHLRWKGSTHALRATGEIWIALVLVAAFQFAVASVMTGAESRRSFFLFNALFDLSLIALVLRGAAFAGTVFAGFTRNAEIRDKLALERAPSESSSLRRSRNVGRDASRGAAFRRGSRSPVPALS